MTNNILTSYQRSKIDNNDDSIFYCEPKLVNHLDEKFRNRLTDLYRETISNKSIILDLMSSWISHLPSDVKYQRVIGHGLNIAELQKNKRLDFLKSYELFVNFVDDDEVLKKITTNTLITTGENDVGSTPEMSRNLSKIIMGSKFVEIKKGKHLCSVECADTVNMTFKEFIDQHHA